MSDPSASTVRRGLARRRVWLAAAAATLMVVATSQASTHGARAASSAAVVTVKLQNIAIHPPRVTIKAGTTVKWLWLDADIDTEHNVTSKAGGLHFKSSSTMQSGSYSVKFETPGKYFYECTIHPQAMQGEIIVTK